MVDGVGFMLAVSVSKGSMHVTQKHITQQMRTGSVCGWRADAGGRPAEMTSCDVASIIYLGWPWREEQRRDGFEVGNADKIFESTYVGSARARGAPAASQV